MLARNARTLLLILIIAILALNIVGYDGCGDDEKAAGSISAVIQYDDGSKDNEDSYMAGHSQGERDGYDGKPIHDGAIPVVTYKDGSKNSDTAYDDGYLDGFAAGSAMWRIDHPPEQDNLPFSDEKIGYEKGES